MKMSVLDSPEYRAAILRLGGAGWFVSKVIFDTNTETIKIIVCCETHGDKLIPSANEFVSKEKLASVVENFLLSPDNEVISEKVINDKLRRENALLQQEVAELTAAKEGLETDRESLKKDLEEIRNNMIPTEVAESRASLTIQRLTRLVETWKENSQEWKERCECLMEQAEEDDARFFALENEYTKLLDKHMEFIEKLRILEDATAASPSKDNYNFFNGLEKLYDGARSDVGHLIIKNTISPNTYTQIEICLCYLVILIMETCLPNPNRKTLHTSVKHACKQICKEASMFDDKNQVIVNTLILKRLGEAFKVNVLT